MRDSITPKTAQGSFLVWLLLLCAVMPMEALAAYRPMTFEPVPSLAGQVPSMVLSTFGCDSLSSGIQQFRELEQEGNVIRVTYLGVTAPVPCTFQPITVAVPLVPLEAGTYRVEFYRRQLFEQNVVNLMVQGTLIVGSATSEATQIPSLPGPSGITALLVIIGLAAGYRLRSQGR